jgi:hypothetical protein
MLFRTDVDLEPLRLYRYDKGRFHIELFQPHYDSSEALYLGACGSRK